MTDIAERIYNLMLRPGFHRKDDQETLLDAKREIERLRAPVEWQPMGTAPRDGSPFVVKFISGHEELFIVTWDEYADEQGGWWLSEGAVIRYEKCVGWSPIPK